MRIERLPPTAMVHERCSGRTRQDPSRLTATTPSAAARTGVPGGAAMSMPQWGHMAAVQPPYAVVMRPTTGHVQVPGGNAPTINELASAGRGQPDGPPINPRHTSDDWIQTPQLGAATRPVARPSQAASPSPQLRRHCPYRPRDAHRASLHGCARQWPAPPCVARNGAGAGPTAPSHGAAISR